jgi:hypothetical protein
MSSQLICKISALLPAYCLRFIFPGTTNAIWRHSSERWRIISLGKYTRNFVFAATNQVRRIGYFNCIKFDRLTHQFTHSFRTAVGSVSAGIWRIFLMPIDTSKTVLQVEGPDGWNKLREKILESGPSPLYQGAVASAAATAAGQYVTATKLTGARFLQMILSHTLAILCSFPWFLTFNFLNDKLPVISKEDDLLLFLVRSALLGLSASCVSDCVSNSLRVIKTTKQTASLGDGEKKEISYQEALAMVLETDGVLGLLGRGLQTRLLTNAIQGALFSVLWKYFLAAS